MFSVAHSALDERRACERCGVTDGVRRFRARIQVGGTIHPETIWACTRTEALSAAAERNGRLVDLVDITFFDSEP